MKTVKVIFDNGDTITTSINGTHGDIMEYYRQGMVFNIGAGENDKLSCVKLLEFLT